MCSADEEVIVSPLRIDVFRNLICENLCSASVNQEIHDSTKMFSDCAKYSSVSNFAQVSFVIYFVFTQICI